MKKILIVILIIMYILGIGIYFVDIGIDINWTNKISMVLLLVPTIVCRQYFVTKKVVKAALSIIIVIWLITLITAVMQTL